MVKKINPDVIDARLDFLVGKLVFLMLLEQSINLALKGKLKKLNSTQYHVDISSPYGGYILFDLKNVKDINFTGIFPTIELRINKSNIILPINSYRKK